MFSQLLPCGKIFDLGIANIIHAGKSSYKFVMSVFAVAICPQWPKRQEFPEPDGQAAHNRHN